MYVNVLKLNVQLCISHYYCIILLYAEIKQPCVNPSGEAYLSDAASFDLPSNAARASRPNNLSFLRPTDGETYQSDAVNTELPLDTTRAQHSKFRYPAVSM